MRVGKAFRMGEGPNFCHKVEKAGGVQEFQGPQEESRPSLM